jgi:hypothetical protein
MKDLNELMQAIVKMDAAQRQATENAMAQRRQAMDDLPQNREKIAQEYAASARGRAEKAAEELRSKNDAALAALAAQQREIEQKLQMAAQLQEGEWADALAKRALEG